MKAMKMAATAMLVTACCTSLTGCNLRLKSVRVYGECTSSTASGGSCKSGVDATWEPGGKQFAPLLALVAEADIVPDAAQFSLDTAGSTIPYPASGTVVVKLKVSSTGATQATKSFGWVRNGTIIKLQDPDAVNAWALANAGDADNINYQLAPFYSAYGSGTKTIAGAAKDGAETLASFHNTFINDCPRYPTPDLCRND